MEMLVDSRSRVGISPGNPYLFTSGEAEDAAPLRGSDCVRLFAKKAGAVNISATAYRKHAATMLQLLQLSDTELDVVARFMGHDIRVHRSYYRLPERTAYAAKVSKILMAMEKGMGGFAGQKLDDLDPVNTSYGEVTEGQEPSEEGVRLVQDEADPEDEDDPEDEGVEDVESGQEEVNETMEGGEETKRKRKNGSKKGVRVHLHTQAQKKPVKRRK